jgi:hypothetical protein
MGSHMTRAYTFQMRNSSAVGPGHIVMAVDLIHTITPVVKNGMPSAPRSPWVRLATVAAIIKLITTRECAMLYAVYAPIRSQDTASFLLLEVSMTYK